MGQLVLVPTPIGNLKDITLRALDTLREAHWIAAEDTRHTRKLLSAHHIHTPLRPLHEHSSPGQRTRVLDAVDAGQTVALVSDAGTPLVSDPGQLLVREAIERGLSVDALPGPCAAVTAWTLSGLTSPHFTFFGFLPRSGAARRQAITALNRSTTAHILYESPKRIGRTLHDLQDALPSQTPVALARELTKRHQEVVHGTLDELCQRPWRETKGEITLVLGALPSNSHNSHEVHPDQLILALLEAKLSPRDASRITATVLGLSKTETYKRALALR